MNGPALDLNPVTVTLPPSWIARSRRYGLDVAAGYRAGRNPASRAVSTHGAEFDPDVQTLGRMAECVMCLWLGVDCERLYWGPHCDPGFDLAYRRQRIDVKATRHKRGRYLIWPIGKRHIFQSKYFEVLFLVRGEPPTFEIVGWIDKTVFARKYQIAPSGHALDAGTWYMEAGDLFPPQDFIDCNAWRAA